MKKFALHLIAIAVLTIAAACSKDAIDEPIPTTCPEDQGVTTPAPNDDPAADPADANAEEEEYREPEPLTEEIRPLYGETKKWVRHSVYLPQYKAKESTWTEICAYNGMEFDGKKSWSFYDITANYLDPDAMSGIFVEDGATLTRFSFAQSTPKSYLCFTTSPEALRRSEYGYLLQSYGTIVVEGKTRRAIRIQREGVADHDFWIEGIGALRGEIFEHPFTWVGVHEPMYVEIVECYDGMEKIFDLKNFSEDLYTPEETFFPAL